MYLTFPLAVCPGLLWFHTRLFHPVKGSNQLPSQSLDIKSHTSFLTFISLHDQWETKVCSKDITKIESHKDVSLMYDFKIRN